MLSSSARCSRHDSKGAPVFFQARRIDENGDKRRFVSGTLHDLPRTAYALVVLRAPLVGDLEVDLRGAEVGMAEVIRDIGDVEALFRHVGADAVSEHMAVSPIEREICDRSVTSKEVVDRSTGERRACSTPAAEEIRTRIIAADREVAAKECATTREEHVRV